MCAGTAGVKDAQVLPSTLTRLPAYLLTAQSLPAPTARSAFPASCALRRNPGA